MRVSNLSIALLVLCVAMAPACSKKSGKEDASKQIALPETGFCGWNSLTLRNMFVRFDVVPEIGGRIMGYEMRGYQALWHDLAKEGQTSGAGFNPGGAGVWFASRDGRGGIANAVYEAEAGDSVITVTSPVDSSGLQFKKVYSLVSGSSLVRMTLSAKNVSGGAVEGTLRQTAAVSADSGCAVFVPVKKGNWRVVSGNKANPAWQNAGDGLFCARFAGQPGGVEMQSGDGWMAWYDAANGLVFVMMFPVEKGVKSVAVSAGDDAFFQGGAVEACAPETSRMALELRGPVARLNPGETASLDVTWGVCRCSGIRRLASGGVVTEPLALKDGVVTGAFGVFDEGYLHFVCLDKAGNSISNGDIGKISPLAEVVVRRPISDLPSKCVKVQYGIRSIAQGTTILLDEVVIRK